MSDGGKGSGRRPGTGFDPSHARIWPRCNTCRGKGYVMVRHPDPVKVPESAPCPACAEQKSRTQPRHD